MNDAFYVAATGMSAQQLSLNTVSNNLANMSTPAYKSGRVTFKELVAQEFSGRTTSKDAPFADAKSTSGLLPRLSGVAASFAGKDFSQGAVSKTGRTLDLAINGDGFIEVTLPDGTVGYSRGGALQVNQDGLLATAEGYPLKPSIAVPADATELTISPDGIVTAKTGSRQAVTELGKLGLWSFSNPGALAPQGDSLYRSTDASGDPIHVKASTDAAGSFAQGFLEGSNVNMTNEMVNLMMAQRVYSMNVKVVQACEELMSMANNLRK